MTFDTIVAALTQLKERPLPGLAAHKKLIPPTRKLVHPTQFLVKQPKIAGVMALIYPKEGAATLVFTQRHTYKGVHSAQISFPGGKKDPTDTDTWETAKREAFEEVSVQPQKSELICPLTPVYIPPSNFFVEPYLAISHCRPDFIPQASEVKEIIEVPLGNFLEDNTLVDYEVPGFSGVFTPAFRIENRVIWGATAMMVSEIIHHISQSKY